MCINYTFIFVRRTFFIFVSKNRMQQYQQQQPLLSDQARAEKEQMLYQMQMEAQQKAYKAANAIDWPNGFYRRDIGWRAVARETKKI